MSLRDKHYNYFHFADEQTKAQERLGKLDQYYIARKSWSWQLDYTQPPKYYY